MKTNINRPGLWSLCLLAMLMIGSFGTTLYAADPVCLPEVTPTNEIEVPPICDESDWNRSGYIAGVVTGQNLLTSAWLKIKTCDLIERFESIVMPLVFRLEPLNDASLYTACRYSGYRNGIMSAMDSLYRCCEETCYRDGEIIGEIVATMYCELSLMLNGLATAEEFVRAPVQLCGFNFEFACDITFLYETMSYVNDIGACFPYTIEPHYEVWDQVRNNSCAYKIEEIIPPPDGPPDASN